MKPYGKEFASAWYSIKPCTEQSEIIGNNVTLFAGAKVYSETEIGNYCTIHSGVIIGSDGFGFAPNTDGTYSKIPQIGNVIIGDYVGILFIYIIKNKIYNFSTNFVTKYAINIKIDTV